MRRNKMKLTICMISMLLVLLVTLPVFANNDSEFVNEHYELKGFENVDLATDDAYETLEPTTSQEMNDNAILGGAVSYSKERSSSPVWKNENGVKNFYDGTGKLMYKNGTKYVIDVSEHNGTIDWEKVKAAGVDGAIIRVGWGVLGRDAQFQRNISECNRLGIPYGVYLYSYAYDKNFALEEAQGTVEMLKEADVNLSYPIYYDIEKFSNWNDSGITRKPPSDVSTYEQIIGTYLNYMSENGYAGKVHVYSYRSYLNSVLNSPSIHAYTSWVAEYGPKLNFTNNHYGGEQGWQYTSDGSVDGIKGRVDLNCFSDQFFNTSLSQHVPESLQTKFQELGITMREGYLYGIALGSDISELGEQLSVIGQVTWLNKDGKGVNGGHVTTNQTLKVTITTKEVIEEIEESEKIETFTYKLVEKGDVDGDGQIRSLDYALIKNDILGIKKLQGAYMKAADIDKDGQIRSIDYAHVKNDILNIKKIEQR